MPIKIGVIGLGVIAGTHIPVLKELNDVKITGLCDLNTELIDKWIEETNAPQTTTDYKELIHNFNLDAVIILTDHFSHSEIAIEALKNGLHVLLEKPLCANSQQIKGLMKTSEENPHLICGGIFQNRYNPGFSKAKELVDRGECGQLLSINLSHRSFRSNEYYSKNPWRGDKKLEGGSALINQSIHFLDQVIQIGGEIDSLCGFSDNINHTSVCENEDTLAGIIRFKNKSVATINITNASLENWERQIIITGTKGTIILQDDEIKLINLNSLEEELSSYFKSIHLKDTEGKSYYGNGHFQNIKNFIDTIQEKSTLDVNLASSAYSTRAVHLFYESNSNGKVLPYSL